MEVIRGLGAENDDFEDAPWRPMNKRREREVHSANARNRLCPGSATLARRSVQPPDSSLRREMEVLRGLQAEDDGFEDALGGPAGRRIGAVRAGWSTVQMQHRALLGGSATQARRSV